MTDPQGIAQQSSLPQPPVSSPASKPAFVEPKLIFVEPKLTRQGDVADVTAGFFGSFSP